MTGKERLTATLKGDPVDRPALNLYEIGGFEVDPEDRDDPYNIYNSPSWKELLHIAEEQTDVIRMRTPDRIKENPLYNEFFKIEKYEDNNSLFTKTTLKIGKKELTSLTRRDRELDTIWTLKHLLDSEEDLKLFLTLPDEVFDAKYDVSNLFEEEKRTGDKGLVMVDTGDPLCEAAGLFSFENYALTAMTEQDLFHQLLEKLSKSLYRKTKQVSKEFPGRLWRIYGPEYATEPYLPPYLFKDYVQKYTGPMIEEIQKHGGFARIHSHGKLKNVLDIISDMNVDAIDPIEPPPQGDVELEYVADHYGKDIVLFGNVEITDIENMETAEFEKKTARSIEAGMKAKGFVLLPSSSPYGRDISEQTMTNYKTMVRLVKG